MKTTDHSSERRQMVAQKAM